MSTMLLPLVVLFIVQAVMVDTREANFDGQQYIRYTIGKKTPTDKDKVTLRFKTTEAYGVLLYSCGKEGDFLLLELKRGKLIYTGNFGSFEQESGVHRIVLDHQYNNNIWHSLSLVRSRTEIGTRVYLTIDGHTKSHSATMKFNQLNLDNYVYVGGMSKRARDSYDCSDLDLRHKKNYTGCLSGVRFNSQDILYATYENLSNFAAIGGVKFTCPVKQFDIIGFEKEESMLEVSRSILKRNVSSYVVELRSIEGNGHILTHNCTDGTINVDLIAGKVRLKFTFLGLSRDLDVPIMSDIPINDGDWHRVAVVIKRHISLVELTVDKVTKRFKFPANFSFYHQLGVFTGFVRFGGKTPGLPGLITCFRSLEVDGEKIRSDSHRVTKKIGINNICQIKDLCFPNPCLHGSKCTQSRGKMKCHCGNTGYKGEKCETCTHSRTCAEIWDSGVRKSGYYKICPNNERIFEVYCDMNIKATVITHNIRNNTLVDSGIPIHTSMSSLFMHEVEYAQDMEYIVDLLKQSPQCRQYIRYDCKNSHLLYDLGDKRHIHYKGARFISRDSEIQNYWGGSNDEKRTCACGMDNSCDRSTGVRKDCNCDIGDSIWRYDAGFITNKSVLPVSAVQFSVGPETYQKSFFSVGRLECFGTYPRPTIKETTTITTTTAKPIVINQFILNKIINRRPPVPMFDDVKMNMTVSTDAPIQQLTPAPVLPSPSSNKSSNTVVQSPLNNKITNNSYPWITKPTLDLNLKNRNVSKPNQNNSSLPYWNNTDIRVVSQMQRKSKGEEGIFWKPWLIIIAVIGSVLCLFIIFMIVLLFRQKCVYGKHTNKPRIEIEDYNRYSTATEESSDWEVHRLSTTFPTSTPEPSYGPTDDESVNMRTRTLDDVRGKKRFKRLHGWSSQTASAPTVVGVDSKPSFTDISNHFYINSSRENQRVTYDSKTNESFQDCESIAETAYSTTATDGMINGSVSDLNSEYSKNSTHFSTESSLKESEYTSTPVKKMSDASIQPAPSLTNTSDQDLSPPTQQRHPPYKKPFVPPHGQKHGQHAIPILLPINGFREPSIRRAHPVKHSATYSNHVAVLNNNVGNFALVNGSVARIVTKRSPENTPLLIHPPTIEEREEDSHVDSQSVIYDNSLNLNGFYGDYDNSPNSETRLLFGDANSIEECTREADKQIQLLKRKVIEKATSADDSM